jgi:site-specific recombinase XerD
MTTPYPKEPISPLRARMIDDMRVRNFSLATQRGYIRGVKMLAAYLRRSPDTATAEEVRSFQRHLAATGITPGVQNMTVSGLRFFFQFTVDKPETTRHLVYTHQPQKLPRVLSSEEISQLLAAAPEPKDKAMLSVAYGAGLRAMEVVTLKVSDIDSKRMLLRVGNGKGGKDRYVMLSPTLLEALRDWYRIARPSIYLFPGRDKIAPMTTRQFHRICQGAAKRAGLPKWVGPHTLRHSFATHLLENNIDVRVIQVLLGHAQLDTTARYTQVATSVIRRVMSPIDRLIPLDAQPAAPPEDTLPPV